MRKRVRFLKIRWRCIILCFYNVRRHNIWFTERSIHLLSLLCARRLPAIFISRYYYRITSYQTFNTRKRENLKLYGGISFVFVIAEQAARKAKQSGALLARLGRLCRPVRSNFKIIYLFRRITGRHRRRSGFWRSAAFAWRKHAVCRYVGSDSHGSASR